MRNIVITFFLVFLNSSLAQAHSVWVNVFPSKAHQPPHAMVSLGWGHALPVDDILNSPNGRIQIKTFELIAPDLKKTNLILPSTKENAAMISGENVAVFPGNLATQKVAFKKDSSLGVYQFALSSIPNFYTQYIDTKGRKRLVLKPKDEVKDVKKIIMSFKYQAFAKSYLSFGEWKMPEPLGHGLEIIPRTDLGHLHVGDLVEVDVLFYGKPLATTAKSINFITAHSPGFGQSDGFELFSYLINGKAQFRVQNAGQWIINVNHKDDVSQDGPLKHLFGKVDQVYHGASLTFNVK